MWTLSSAAERRLGKRASAYVTERGMLFGRNRDVLVPDHYETPRGVERTLTRVYGRPETIDRGEVAYWRIPAADYQRAEVV